MKYFRHDIAILGDFIKSVYLIIGDECRIYKDYGLEKIYTQEETNELLEYEIDMVNLYTE